MSHWRTWMITACLLLLTVGTAWTDDAEPSNADADADPEPVAEQEIVISATHDYSLTAEGWALMLVSCVGMTAFLAWCMVKVLSTPGSSEHLHAQLDVDTHDQDT